MIRGCAGSDSIPQLTGRKAQEGFPLSIPLPPSPKSAKTVPLGTFITVVIMTFVFGAVAGGGAASENKSSDLDAANKRISQLESQIAVNASQAPAAESAAPATEKPTTEAVPAAAAPATQKSTTEAVPAAAVTLSGDGKMKSKKVSLGGDYSVSWKTLGSCYYSADLEGGGGRGESVFDAYERPASGTNNVYGLDAADYYLDVITGPAPGCGWSVTLTPIP